MGAQLPGQHAEPEPAGILQARDVTAGYGDLAAVRNVSIQVASGEIVALLGPNGAGKTTLIRALAGIVPLLGGEVRWHGSPTRAPLFKRAREGLALVTEERSVISGMTVRDNLRLGRGGIEPAVALFPELGGLLGRKAGLLSGGEQQMVSLARALAAQPAVLLADELSLGLAPLAVDRLFEGLRDAVTQSRLAVVLVEQQARRALEIADRWCLMRRGQLAGTGSAAERDRLENSYLES